MKRLPWLLLAVILAAPASSSADPPVEITHNWYAEHRNVEAIGYDITTLFLALHQRKQLPIKTYEDTHGQFVLDIMREQNHFVGPTFPRTLDRLLCTLNPHVCKIVSDKTVWSGKAGTVYNVPAITFERYQTPKLYTKTKSERVEDAVVKKTMGCQTLDAACRRTITHLNPALKNPFDPSYSGPITLPGLGVKAVVPGLEELQQPVTTPTAEQRAAGPASPAIHKEWVDAEKRKTEREHILQQLYRGGKEADASVATEAIQKNIPSQGTYRIQSTHVPDFHYKTHQESLFRQISHPLYWGPLPRQVFWRKVVVAILDGYVDPEHCEFTGEGPVHHFNNRSERSTSGPPDRACAQPVVEQGVPTDHGTHVAGLIAGRMNGIGIVGVNPLAHLVTFEAEGLQPLALARLVDEAVLADARIINISMTNPVAGNDPVLERIRNTEQGVLFVVAAGNQALSADDKCDFYPACYYARPNVLTVVALDSDAQSPRVWKENNQKGSNYGTVFHLGVPATGTVSSLAGGRYGRLTGSSQATPVVAAAASLIYMKYPQTAPARVKERLIYTSDLFDTLQRPLFGGRLNVSRALDADEDVIVLRNGETLRGKVKKENRTFFHTAITDDEEQKAALKHVKRLVRQSGATQPFTMIKVHKTNGQRHLERQLEVKVPDNSTWDVVVTHDGGVPRTRVVRLDEVVDYTAALADE